MKFTFVTMLILGYTFITSLFRIVGIIDWNWLVILVPGGVVTVFWYVVFFIIRKSPE